MNNLVRNLKENNEDFEFYPTTDEIIFRLIRDIKKLDESYRFSFRSILDIGAGNGKVLNAIEKVFENVKLYAMEKSPILKSLIDQGIYLIGTDFLCQSLLDKRMTVTFCNPPYSQYENWTVKIIRESCSQYVYLVLPKRWSTSIPISEIIKYRNAEVEIIGSYDFKDAEDRKARAIVDLIRIKLPAEKDDAFDRFFNEEFKDLTANFDLLDSEEEKKKKKKKEFYDLTIGDNYVQRLVGMYNKDIENIKDNYMKVKTLDASLLKEFDVTVDKILAMLKEKLMNMKTLYWDELISRTEKVTSRLIDKKRKTILNVLNEHGNVDFTEANIYTTILWIMKNAGDYIDEQLVEVYNDLITKANCENYKSNKKVFEWDEWRYNREKPTHVFLDYRIVICQWGALDYCYGENSGPARLSESACERIRDILIIANNLGFSCNTNDHRLYRFTREKYWVAGKPQIFTYRNKVLPDVLMEVKAHKNGNLHIRMNQKFALALNVEFGRLKGWIRSATEAAKELDDLEAVLYYKCNYKLLESPVPIMIESK